MNDLVRALGISAGILVLVVALIVIVSIAVVNRGEAAAAGESHVIPDVPVRKQSPPPADGKPAKAVEPAGEQISVPQILVFGVGLFVLAVLALLALSLAEHAL